MEMRYMYINYVIRIHVKLLCKFQHNNFENFTICYIYNCNIHTTLMFMDTIWINFRAPHGYSFKLTQAIPWYMFFNTYIRLAISVIF